MKVSWVRCVYGEGGRVLGEGCMSWVRRCVYGEVCPVVREVCPW